MYIIISHDVDHLSVKEHIFKDLIIPKFFVWQWIEFIKSNISFNELLQRYKEVFTNNWNHIKQLQEFNKKNGVKATYFFWMDNALWLSYTPQQAKEYIKYLLKNWADVGIHWINFDNKEKLKKEFEIFQEISWLENFWIRNHYLRQNKNTKKIMADIWFLFDTTDYIQENYKIEKIDNMYEIPFQIMDGTLFNFNQKWLNLEQAKQYTMNLLNQAIENKQKYFAILFHQRYFTDSFKTRKNWYIWFVSYCKDKKYTFINYKDLINELNK